jgi:precorrin-6x reductase
MKKLLIFGGTSEEHALIKALAPFDLTLMLSVVSDYGRQLAAVHPGIRILTGRLDTDQMSALLRRENSICVVDATHPYAAEATANIKAAASAAGIPYLRLQRRHSDLGSAILVNTISEAAEKLNNLTGNVLLTTGSKELSAFRSVTDYRERLYLRVLPTEESINACLSSGFLQTHIIAMHGPFSKELNVALMRQFNIRTLVTKDGGTQGGFPEKLAAAADLKASIIVIRRPDDEGLTESALISRIGALLEEQT